MNHGSPQCGILPLDHITNLLKRRRQLRYTKEVFLPESIVASNNYIFYAMMLSYKGASIMLACLGTTFGKTTPQYN